MAEGRQLLLVPDLAQPVEVEQLEDGKEVPQPSLIAMAARDGEVTALQDALSSGVEDVDSLHQGYTGLHLAIIYGRVDAGLMLIAHGADANREDPSGDSPLDLCALSNSLSDEDSTRLARSLLLAGADPNHTGPAGYPPRTLAEMRGKRTMAQVLSASA